MRLSGWVPLLWVPLLPLLERRRARCAAALDDEWRRVALSLAHVLALRRALTPSQLTAYWVQLAILQRRILDNLLLRRHHDG